jgi:2-polyprenyl-6-methoxyphenol hydroxylase-like FAD-dependent oxidoreductase
MGKRVLTYIPGNRYVTVKCSTGDLITCDILVGADGFFSAVRQNLYVELNAKGLLPPKDSQDIALTTVRLVGQTIPLDPEEFPAIKDENCQFMRIVSDSKPYSVSYELF